MISLSININKIALIRNSRSGDYPNLADHARKCVAAGADGITVHPRPDQRHVRADDIAELASILTVEFNIEGNPFAGAMASQRIDICDYPGFMPLVTKVRPAQCTLVPDSQDQLTSDHGFNLKQQAEKIEPIISELKKLGIRVSLFMDPDPEQIALAKQVGADRIELYTGPYADCFRYNRGVEASFASYCRAAEAAVDAGLGINAGHDLNLHNLPLFATLPGLQEVSIGHAFTVDALELGLVQAMQAYQRCLGKKV